MPFSPPLPRLDIPGRAELPRAKEADMAQVNDMKTEHESRYQTPTFDPHGAFARTLRGGEMARLSLLS
jgi:hypothetical protein